MCRKQCWCYNDETTDVKNDRQEPIPTTTPKGFELKPPAKLTPPEARLI